MQRLADLKSSQKEASERVGLEASQVFGGACCSDVTYIYIYMYM